MNPHDAPASPTYSVVIPAFNSGPGLEQLINRLEIVFKSKINAEAEFIVVNDGSTNPQTLELLKTLEQHSLVQVIHLTRNFGKSGAVVCGLNAARGDWIVTIDDDLQQKPEDIAALVEHNGHDVVIATYRKKHHNILQRITSRIKSHFDKKILGFQRRLSPLKLISRDVVDGMISISTNRPFIPALISEITTDIFFVELEHQPSAQAQSRYNFARRLRQFSNLVIGNSPILMHFIAIVGVLLALLSFSLAGVIIGRKLLGYTVESGWSSIMVAILFIGGLNLTAFGLVGEYLIRIIDNISNKPPYAIRHRRIVKQTEAVSISKQEQPEAEPVHAQRQKP